jgi:ABC-type antimicrobial peptide transport system permease subunit
MRTVRSARLQEVAQTATYLAVATSFAGVTLLLVSLGVFASTASMVARRSPELAIRQAVGATPRQARHTILAAIGKWWAVAALFGAGLSAAAGKLMASWQVGLLPLEAIVIAGAVVVVTTTMALAAWLPLRRALRIEPALLMRAD